MMALVKTQQGHQHNVHDREETRVASGGEEEADTLRKNKGGHEEARSRRELKFPKVPQSSSENENSKDLANQKGDGETSNEETRDRKVS